MCVVAIYVENERSRSRSPRGSECCSADSQNETEVGPASHCTAEIAAHAVARKGSSIDPLQRRDHVGGLFLASACCVRLSWAVLAVPGLLGNAALAQLVLLHLTAFGGR